MKNRIEKFFFLLPILQNEEGNESWWREYLNKKLRYVFLTKKILSACNWTRTQNHVVLKRTLNHLAKLAKWVSCVLSTYLCDAFDCMFFSYHSRKRFRMNPHSIVAWTRECRFTLKCVINMARIYSQQKTNWLMRLNLYIWFTTLKTLK